MVVRHNLVAENAMRYNNLNTKSLSKKMEKLSSGYKINRAGDNAAGLAVSEKMRAQAAGLTKAVKNAEDGISMIQTFEGALNETHKILNRIKTLATQSANGIYSDETDRAAIELEYEQLIEEIDDIADTDFNGVRVLNLDGTGGASPATYTADLSALSTDFSAQFKQSFVDASLDAESAIISAKHEAPASPVSLSSGGAVSFAYSMGATSAEIVFDVMQDGTSIGKGTFDFDDYVKNTEATVNLTGTGGENFGIIKLSFNHDPAIYPFPYLTEVPIIKPAALDELADAIASLVDGDAEFEITYTPNDISDPITTTYMPYNAKADEYIPLNFYARVDNQSTKDIGISFSIEKDDVSILTIGTVRLGNLDSAGKSTVIDASSLGKFTVTLKSGTVGNAKSRYTVEETSTAPFSSFKLEKRIDTHTAIAQTPISGMSAAPTEISGGMGGDTGTPGDVTTTATGVSLQVGARTKDLKTYDFDYIGVWDSTAIQKQAIGELDANINATAKGLGLVTDSVNLSTQFNANRAIDFVDYSINKISMIRATFGAIHNRLDHKIDNLSVTDENLTAAESRIRDTNVAEEVKELSKARIISQASQAMLAQANQLPSSVLSLLQ
jgi:flagellin